MLLLYRNGQHVPLARAAAEFLERNIDPEEILAGALAGDDWDQEAVWDFLGIVCVRNAEEADDIAAEWRGAAAAMLRITKEPRSSSGC